MHTANADICIEDASAHTRDDLGSKFADLFVVVPVRLEDVEQRLGDGRLGELGGLEKAVPRLDRVDSGDDRNRDARPPHALHPLHEQIHVVEHLCEDQGASSVDLLFEPHEFEFEFLWWEELVLGETGDGDFEVVAVVLANVTDKIDAMFKTTFYGRPFVLACWGVTAKGEDIAAAMQLCFLTSMITGPLGGR